MAKYALIGGYTSEAWAKMIENPGDRVAAVRKVAEAAGGKLESFFWSMGEDDYLAIVDAPDDILDRRSRRGCRQFRLVAEPTDDQAVDAGRRTEAAGEGEERQGSVCVTRLAGGRRSPLNTDSTRMGGLAWSLIAPAPAPSSPP